MSILDAANEAQVLLPYSCKVGRCTSCKRKLLQGNTAILSPELGLTEEEKSDGWILSCVRFAEEDLLLEAEKISKIEIPASRTWPCRIETLSHVAVDVIRVELVKKTIWRDAPWSAYSFSLSAS